MDKKQTVKQFFPALTGYRAIAAWMIFVYHFTPFNSPKYPAWIKAIVWEFHIGVDMFFVLSGFLIAYRYFNDYPIHFKKYMVNRIARIYPMYLLITLAVFVVWYLQNQSWDIIKTYELLSSVTMSKALFSSFFLSGIPQGWTLTLEEMFYLTAPLYFILIRKWKGWLLLLPPLIFGIFAGLKMLSDIPGNTYGFLQTNIHAYIIEFFAGIGLAYIMLKKQFPISTRYTTWFGLAIIAIYLLGKRYVVPYFDIKTDFGRFIEMSFLSIFGIVPLLWGLIHEKTFVQKILGSNIFILLGKSSYIFYLIHMGVIANSIYNNITTNKFLLFLILNLLSILIFKFIEEPVNVFIRSIGGLKSNNN